MNCSKCNAPMKLVPAGVSKKTGKPYNEFFSCVCGNTYNPKNTFKPGGVGMSPNVRMEKIDNARIEQMHHAKHDSAAFLNARNAAVQLTVLKHTLRNSGYEITDEELKSQVDEMTEYFYQKNIEPKANGNIHY